MDSRETKRDSGFTESKRESWLEEDEEGISGKTALKMETWFGARKTAASPSFDIPIQPHVAVMSLARNSEEGRKE